MVIGLKQRNLQHTSRTFTRKSNLKIDPYIISYLSNSWTLHPSSGHAVAALMLDAAAVGSVSVAWPILTAEVIRMERQDVQELHDRHDDRESFQHSQPRASVPSHIYLFPCQPRHASTKPKIGHSMYDSRVNLFAPY